MSSYHAEYHRIKRLWYLWDGHEAIVDESGELRLFLTAQDAHDWLAAEATHAS